MTATIAHFFIAFGLSFIGSLPPGIINMTVAMTAIRKNISAAFLVSIGAALVEFIQVFVALKFSYLLSTYGDFQSIFSIIALLIFVGLSVYYLFFAPTQPPKLKEKGAALGDFFKGMAVSSANVMVFPYWIFYGTWLGSNGWLIHDNFHISIFSAGVAVGAFSVFLLFLKLASIIVKKVDNLVKIANRTVGFIFIILAILQLWQLVK